MYDHKPLMNFFLRISQIIAFTLTTEYRVNKLNRICYFHLLLGMLTC